MTKPRPCQSRRSRIEAKRFEQVEREFEPIGFLGVDVESDVVASRQQRQRLQSWQQLGVHAIDLRTRIARMQRGELDRDARTGIRTAPARRVADGVDRVFVGCVVARCVRRGERGFAQHVVGILEAHALHRAAFVERGLDRLSGDELFAHHPDRQVDTLADQRLSAQADQACECRRQAALACGGGQGARDREAPRRSVDEQGIAVPEVRPPVAGCYLVADERVARGIVGDAQQRLGEAHEGHAFLGRQRVFPDQRVDAGARTIRSQALYQFSGERMRALGVSAWQGGGRDQRRQAFGLRAAVRCGDRSAQRCAREDAGEANARERHGRHFCMAPPDLHAPRGARS